MCRNGGGDWRHHACSEVLEVGAGNKDMGCGTRDKGRGILEGEGGNAGGGRGGRGGPWNTY